MKTLTLTLVNMPSVGVEAEVVKPESFAGKTKNEIKDLTVYAGKKRMRLGDVFKVEGDVAEKPEDQQITVENSNAKLKRVGESMTCGEITIKGDVGYHLGECMRGGKITVEGNASSWVGTSMEGGEIIVLGNAGSYIGASSRGLAEGMKGGYITVQGNVGTEVGVGLSGGEINVSGFVSDFCGSYMRGGTIKVRTTGERVGYAMRGGEIFIGDRGYTVPLYFTKSSEEDDYVIYEGDVSFGGKGTLKKRR